MPTMNTPANMSSKHAMRFTTLHEWLSWQESLHYTAIELGLDRCRLVAERMGLLTPEFKVISIAGTNGKGSSAAMLDKILRQSGLSVGTYTSPHLLNYNERISINGQCIDDESLCRSFARIDQHREDISLTYFEFGTLAALDIFNATEVKLDMAIMEVGLGGRLDAVNIIDADIALVTTIDFDHEIWLGHDRESIGREKAGIFRADRPAVCADLHPPDSIARCAEEIGAKLYRSGQHFNFAANATSWSWQSDNNQYESLPVPGSNKMQVQNAAGVIMVVELLADEYSFDVGSIAASLRDFRLAGRLQSIPGEIPCILDVAHNPQAVSALVANMNKIPSSGENHLVIGMLKDKKHDVVFGLLQQIADHWHLADIESDRAASVAELKEVVREFTDDVKISQYRSVKEALVQAKANASPGDRIIITGSFVTVGAAIEYLDND